VSTKPVMDTKMAGRRNRCWPEALRREIVAASVAPGASVSKVARHYDVNANQVFQWRKRYRDEAGPPAVALAPELVAVRVTTEKAAVTQSTLAETIEIDVGVQYRVRVGKGVDAQALRRVIDVLEGR
jgi:transposase-like protein